MHLAQRAADPRPAETRRRILDTSLRLFAEHGFKGVSVRDISVAAGVNVAAVNYHFGSKQGLYRTIFQTVLDEDEARFAEQMDNLTALLDSAGHNPTLLLGAVEILAAGTVRRIAAYEHAHWFSVLLARELAFPGDLFEVLYRRRVEPMLTLLSRLVAVARGASETEEETRLTANLVHGQALNLVFSKAILWRQAGWDGGYTPERVDLLTRALADLLHRAIGLSADSIALQPSGTAGGRQ